MDGSDLNSHAIISILNSPDEESIIRETETAVTSSFRSHGLDIAVTCRVFIGETPAVVKGSETLRFAIANAEHVLGSIVVSVLHVTSSLQATCETLAAVAGAALTGLRIKAEANRAEVVSSALCDAVRLTTFASSIPFDELLGSITKLTLRLVAAERVAVYLADEVRREIYCVQSLSVALKQVLRIPFGRGIAGTVAEFKRPYRVANVYADPLFDSKIDERTGFKTRSMICLPILSLALAGHGPRLLGVLQILNKIPGPESPDAIFTAAEEHVLTSFCAEVASALECCERQLLFEKFRVDDLDRALSSHVSTSSVLLHYWRGSVGPDNDLKLVSPGYRHRRGSNTMDSFHFLHKLLPTVTSSYAEVAALPAGVETSPRAGFSPSISKTPVADGLPRIWRESPPLAGRHECVQRLLRTDFSALHLTEPDAPLTFVDMIHRFGIFDSVLSFPGAAGAVHDLAKDIISNYRIIPYHNWRHGFAVSHIVFIGLERTASAEICMQPIDKLAALFAALAHDVDHRGHTNSFEINAVTELALRYNNQSVLENHHAATLFKLLLRHDEQQGSKTSVINSGENVLHLDRLQFTQFRRVAISAILATDMTEHARHVERLRGLSLEDSLRLPADELAGLFTHAGDLAAQLSPDFSAAFEWMERCSAEFYAQALLERESGLATAPFMLTLDSLGDRIKQHIVFLDYVVAPLWSVVCAAFPELKECADALPRHRIEYEKIADGHVVLGSDLTLFSSFSLV